MKLRRHQKDCVKALKRSLSTDKNSVPYAQCVTAFGKTHVLAKISIDCVKKGNRVIQLVHNTTACRQNYDCTVTWASNTKKVSADEVGCESAKLRTTAVSEFSIVIAVTATLVNRLDRVPERGFDVLLIDECDLVSPRFDSMTRTIIRFLQRLNPSMRILGLTGSPWRTDQGWLHDEPRPEAGDRLFTDLVYESDINQLIDNGYLCKPTTINVSDDAVVDLTGIKKSSTGARDFNQIECGVRFEKIIDLAVEDLKHQFGRLGIQTSLIFASSVDNGRHIVKAWGDESICKLVYGEMLDDQQDQIMDWLENGEGIRIVVNCQLYTRGYDFPALDHIALLRSTASRQLYFQIVGRVLRAHKGKLTGYISDYGGNIDRFGAIDQRPDVKRPGLGGDAPMKICLQCNEINSLNAKNCRKCEMAFVADDDAEGGYRMQSSQEVITGKSQGNDNVKNHYIERIIVDRQLTGENSKKPGVPMIKILFMGRGDQLIHREFYCVDHPGSWGKKSVLKIASLMQKNVSDALYNLYDDLCSLSSNSSISMSHIITAMHKTEPMTFRSVACISIKPSENDSRFTQLTDVTLTRSGDIGDLMTKTRSWFLVRLSLIQCTSNDDLQEYYDDLCCSQKSEIVSCINYLQQKY